MIQHNFFSKTHVKGNNGCFSDVNFRGSHYANPGTNISDLCISK